MNLFVTSIAALTVAALSSTASAQSSAVNLAAPDQEQVSFTRAEVNMLNKQGSLAASTVTYYGPKVWVNGRLESFFVGSTNGNTFCEARGHNQEVSGSTVTYGEDESSYADYDWYGSAWIKKSTGSKNQCYPLYATIKCR
ncbi:hypothetical protein [Pseudoalteromonas ruthenica]|uniref:hypothetical protein n=1 Tax=Pseudoalteromonas ruthenica TaxID=151081 RepID=UPI0012476F54|nr:hypothetical protein [Pseudoalteromonas ruthenica]